MEQTYTLAVAQLRGSKRYPNVRGTVHFRQMHHGVMVTAEVWGLPYADTCEPGVFGFHIHEGSACTGTAEEPFADAGSHYDRMGCPHPYHAGDLPPLFGNHGYAYMTVLTDRVTVGELVGRTVIVHEQPDDFTTQPAGNAGARIACGVISARRSL